MKSTLCLLSVAFTVLPVFAMEMTPENRRMLREQIATKPAKGVVLVVDCNSGFDCAKVSQFFILSGKSLEIPHRVIHQNRAFSFSDADNTLREQNANAAIFVVNDPSLPMSLVAAEGKWGLVNVAKVKADDAPDQLVTRRMDKMFSRVLIQILGGCAQAGFEMDAFKPVFNLKDLDALRGLSPSPQARMSMMSYMNQLGFRPSITMPYTRACKEGWAPAPTNEFQRVIWEKVHLIPNKPMKIEFDPATQKGKVTK